MTKEERRQRAARRRAEEAEEDALRREARDQRWSEEGMYLTREEFEAREPCRGCGRPLMGEGLPKGLSHWPGTLHMTDLQRALHDEDEVEFHTRHAGCRGGRWGIQSYRGLHCAECCPPPPLAPSQLAALRALLRAPLDERDLHRGQLMLTCGHQVVASAHRTNGPRWMAPTRRCPDCGATRGVIQSEYLGAPAEVATAQPKPAASRPAPRKRVTKAELEAENVRLRARLLELGATDA